MYTMANFDRSSLIPFFLLFLSCSLLIFYIHSAVTCFRRMKNISVKEVVKDGEREREGGEGEEVNENVERQVIKIFGQIAKVFHHFSSHTHSHSHIFVDSFTYSLSHALTQRFTLIVPPFLSL